MVGKSLRGGGGRFFSQIGDKIEVLTAGRRRGGKYFRTRPTPLKWYSDLDLRLRRELISERQKHTLEQWQWQRWKQGGGQQRQQQKSRQRQSNREKCQRKCSRERDNKETVVEAETEVEAGTK